MNDPTEHPLLHGTSLHDALHAHVRESGGSAAAPYLAGLADGALRAARRQRLVRTGAGIAAAAVIATAGVAITAGTVGHPHPAGPAAGGAGSTGRAALISLLPVASSTEHACAPGSGGYTVPASATHPELCIRTEPAGGMTGVRAASARAARSSIDGTWQVEVTFGSAGRAEFSALTGSLAAAPGDQFAVVIGGRLWDSPSVASPITSGRLDIVNAFEGGLTSAAARDLAHRLDPAR